MNPTKLHKSLSVTLASAPREDEPIPVILKLRAGPVARGEMKALSEVAPGAEFRRLGARATVAAPSMVAALSEDPAVEMIWPDLPVHTWLDEAPTRIGAPRVWDSGFTGRGVRLAVLDTGLDGAHPDFRGRVAAWRDWIDPDGEDGPVDPNGHGTHVAGIAAGDGAASGGRYRGVAPGAELLIARVLDAQGGGRTSTVLAGIEWALDEGARILNISLGGPPYPADGTDALSQMCDAAVAEGAIVCVAAGNLGPAGHTVGAPGAARSAITIGASELGPRGERAALFSSRGPTGDGRTKPDLLFPGVGIVAPRAEGSSLGTPVEEAYMALRGTSQAAPMAAGGAALLLEANPRLDPEDVKDRLMRGALPLVGVEPGAQGAGRGDVYNAFVDAAGEDGAPAPEPVGGEPIPDLGRDPGLRGCRPM